MGYLYSYNKKKRQSTSGGGDSDPMNQKQKNEAHALTTLFFMNLLFIMHLVISICYVMKLFAAEEYRPTYDFLQELTFLASPILTAVCNPVILLARNNDYRQKLRSLVT